MTMAGNKIEREKVKIKCSDCGSKMERVWYGIVLISSFVWIFRCPGCGKYWKIQLLDGEFSAEKISKEEVEEYKSGFYTIKK